MNSFTAAIFLPNTVFVDAKGNHYIVKDVSAAGDCALLSLLNNPSFPVPVSDSLELRRRIVAFAQGAHREDCFTVYGMVGDHSNMHFEAYLQYVLQPRYWVGTVFFIWASMAYGCDIRTHFFNEFHSPTFESTAEFMGKYFMRYLHENMLIVDVFFHQYKNMTQCKPSMYNHYASLLPVPSIDGSLSILSDLVNSVGTPWWKKMEEVNGYDCTLQQPKPWVPQKNLNKADRKKLNKALTYHYLKEQADGDDIATEMERRLEKAVDKQDESFFSAGISGNFFNEKDEKVTDCRSLSATYSKRTWLQRANIIFLFLHPQVGNRNTHRTAELTGVCKSER
jgi:hypothetical protein